MEICYLGPDDKMRKVLRDLFSRRFKDDGYTFSWIAERLPNFDWLDQANLIIVDVWTANYEEVIREFAAKGKIIWAITNVPENLGAENRLAQRIHQLGAPTYLARIYDAEALAEAFDYALQITSEEKVFA